MNGHLSLSLLPLPSPSGHTPGGKKSVANEDVLLHQAIESPVTAKHNKIARKNRAFVSAVDFFLGHVPWPVPTTTTSDIQPGLMNLCHFLVFVFYRWQMPFHNLDDDDDDMCAFVIE